MFLCAPAFLDILLNTRFNKSFTYHYQAQFVPVPDPSLTEQYEYASEHDIKCLVILTDTGAQKGLVKVILI